LDFINPESAEKFVEKGWDEEKRPRLLKAGADILVPDFDEADALVDYLFPG
jgi:hypothetical protein